ncbi:MAG TPA: hypothetical protein VFU02_19205 [Polyangiaceae bacterium]|nr:hypothetical protein [Polyangiaceae bacterium]
MRRAPWLAALAGVSALAGVARAQDEPVLAELEWRGGPSGSSCIDAEALRSTVEARLGRTLFAPRGHADVRVVGGIEAAGGKWLARMTLTSAQGEPMGERELESESRDCSALDDSLALVLAVMLDIPKTRVPEPAPASAASPPTPAVDTPAPAAPPPVSKLLVPKDTPPRRPRWRFEIGLGALGAYGLLPEFTFGVRGHIAVKPPEFWKVGIDVGAYASVDEAIGSDHAGASFSPKELGMFVCPLDLPLSAVHLEACVVQHVGRLHVEGFGFDTNEKQERPYLNLGVAGAASLQIVGPLSVRVGIDAATPLLRETFRYGSQDGEEPSLFRMAPVLIAGQIGVAAHF